MAAARPVSLREFLAANPLAAPPLKIAVAVSGGADSMALLLLLREWSRRVAGIDLVALTVDHGLRAESAAEARQVAAWCRALAVSHRTLHWRGAKPDGNLQAAARQARYAVLASAALKAGAGFLAVAHHLDDQAETVLLRLGRGSGLEGLSGMAANATLAPGLVLWRPLLGFARSRLLATVQTASHPWLEDPSNRNDRFQRVRVREALKLLAPDDVVPERIAATARRFARANEALETVADALFDRSVRAGDPSGAWCRLDPALIASAPADIALRVLRRALRQVSGRALPPDEEPLLHLLARFGGGAMPAGTLHGCRLLAAGGQAVLCREQRHLPAPVAIHRTRAWQVWDGGRVAVRLAQGPAATLAPLGPEGWRQVRESVVRGGILPPRAAALTAPALFDGGKLLAAPWLGFRAVGAGLLQARLATADYRAADVV